MIDSYYPAHASRGEQAPTAPPKREIKPFGPHENPMTCAHIWEPHLYEHGKRYCPYCTTTATGLGEQSPDISDYQLASLQDEVFRLRMNKMVSESDIEDMVARLGKLGTLVAEQEKNLDGWNKRHRADSCEVGEVDRLKEEVRMKTMQVEWRGERIGELEAKLSDWAQVHQREIPAEREACAVIVDGYAKEAPGSHERQLIQKVAKAIRKRTAK